MDTFKEKILFLLHDTPDKCTNIPIHELKQKSLITTVFKGIPTDHIISKVPDWVASGTDRLPLPTGLYSSYDGCFLHPTGAGHLQFDTTLHTAAYIEQQVHNSLEYILAESDTKLQERHFLMWRFWRDALRLRLPAGAFFPADTRMPNHTIWNHTNMVSAIGGCYQTEVVNGVTHLDLTPSFLTIQFGPVQGWIAAAKNTRDLWSGSYLLSWLVAHAIKAISDEYGPDAILYPNMNGQPIFDLLHRDFYKQLNRWTAEDLGYSLDETGPLSVPSLPNKFCCIIPANLAKAAADSAILAAQTELKRIAASCLLALPDNAKLCEEWNLQVDHFLESSFSIFKWPEHVHSKNIADIVTNSGDASLIAEYNYAISTPTNADPRVFSSHSKRNTDGSWTSTLHRTATGKLILSSPTFAWSALLQNSERLLSGVRNIKSFQQVAKSDCGSSKDTLTGKDRVLLTKAELSKVEHFDAENEGDYGAMSIIKRLWPFRYLEPKYNVVTRNKSTHELGKFGYFAVLHIDGDDMGKWMSGEKSPLWAEQLSEKAKQDTHIKAELLSKGVKKSLTPSFHAQLTEALKDFSVHIVPKIVKLYGGSLIYSGGDDVVALLPAESAIACASAINSAFRGESLPDEVGEAELGFCKLRGEEFYRLLPGLNLHMSAGIAIAHAKYPLQSVVEEARAAEKRAKAYKLGIICNGIESGGAIAVNLVKRSGETINWSARWDENPEYLFHVLSELDINAGFIKKLHEAFAIYIPELKYTNSASATMRLASLDSKLKTILLNEVHYVIKKSKVDKAILVPILDYIEAIFGRLEHTSIDQANKESNTFADVSAWDLVGPMLTYQFLKLSTND